MTSGYARRGDAEPNLVEGEFALYGERFPSDRGSAPWAGRHPLSETKATLVYSRLAKRLRTLGLASFADYCALIASPEGGDERSHMLNALTTNVTRFFREPHHFDHLRDQVLAPRLELRARAAGCGCGRPACSTGQEPYSMALTVLSLLPEAANLDIKILATDIDSKVVAQAREGYYPADLVEPIPAEFRNRWMRARSVGGPPVAGRRGRPLAGQLQGAQPDRPLAGEGAVRRHLLPQRGHLFRRADPGEDLVALRPAARARRAALHRPFRARYWPAETHSRKETSQIDSRKF